MGLKGMELFRIFITAVGSYIVLFILVKIMGDREISQMSMFDYINGITIGSIAAEMATALEDDFMKPLVAMLVYSTFAVVMAYVSCKSIKLRRFIQGRPLILLDHGRIYKDNLKKAKIDINEFLRECRVGGYFDLTKIRTAILENNGRISFLPVTSQQPVTAQQMNVNPPQETLVSNVIIDGTIIQENLRVTGNNQAWLEKQLHQQGISDISEVFLATCDSDNKLKLYIKLKEVPNSDFFD